jgi:hypothetical protein
MFTIKQAATKVGISEGLLILWIDTGKFKPSLETSMTSARFPVGSLAQRALAAYAGPDVEVLGWARFSLTAEDVERLGAMVERTSAQRTKSESNHKKGSHYSVQELATLWGLGVDKIRELFENEPGVIKLQKPPRKGRRVYTTLRIPEPVAERVQRRNS